MEEKSKSTSFEYVHELCLMSSDWGEANLNPMVRCYGLKKDRKAKCKSCLFYTKDTCKFGYPSQHSGEYRACLRYKNKARKDELLDDRI